MGKSVTARTISLPVYNESKSQIRFCHTCRHNVINKQAQSNLYSISVSLMKSPLTGLPGLQPLHSMRHCPSRRSCAEAGSDSQKSFALMAGNRTAYKSSTRIRYKSGIAKGRAYWLGWILISYFYTGRECP